MPSAQEHQTQIHKMTDKQNTISLVEEGNFALLSMQGEGLFNPISLEAFNVALDQVEKNEQYQALLITGEGNNFSQGLDLKFLMTLEPADSLQFVENTMVMIGRLLSFPIPVVSLINGHAFGLGAMLALGSDYRVMRSDRGYICLPEVDLAMSFIPSMNALVTNTISGKLRRDMMLTGKRVTGEEAYATDLVDACGDVEQLLGLAQDVVAPALGKDRLTLGRIKQDLNAPILSVVKAGAGQRKS